MNMIPHNAKKGTTALLSLSILLIFVSFTALSAAPDADLWPYWKKHDPGATESVDHGPWGKWLDEYLVRSPDGVNRVRYGQVTEKNHQLLDRYLEQLTDVRVTGLSRDVQMAYWINLYNALTVDLVLKHYPVETIRDIDISPGWFSSGPWDKKLITVEGKELSLNDIEHRILRPIWQDPRIHFAVNCASVGCPNLAPEPYTADRLDRMLDEAARNYINHPRGVTVKGDRLIVSSIFSWYQSDFGDSEAEVIAYLKKYADEELKEDLDRFNSIYDTKYDWSLNDSESGSG